MENVIVSQEIVDQLFLYSGEYWDSDTQLQYLRARWYDPSIGRFISNPLSLNLYTYVHNNPLINIDPTGHYCVSADGNWAHAGGCSSSDSIYLGEDSDYYDSPIIEKGIIKGYVGRYDLELSRKVQFKNTLMRKLRFSMLLLTTFFHDK